MYQTVQLPRTVTWPQTPTTRVVALAVPLKYFQREKQRYQRQSAVIKGVNI